MMIRQYELDMNLNESSLFLDISSQNGPWPEKPIGVLVLDLDGTIRLMPERFEDRTPMNQEIIPEVLAAAWKWRNSGWVVCAATNQSGVGRGERSFKDMLHTLKITDYLCGGLFARMYYCPHAFDADGHPLCNCRKPNPGMLIDAKGVFSQGVMIGDCCEDKEAAIRAGIDFMSVERFTESFGVSHNSLHLERPFFEGLDGAADIVYAVKSEGPVYKLVMRKKLADMLKMNGYVLPSGCKTELQIGRILASAWPVIFCSATTYFHCLTSWLAIALSVGANSFAARRSLEYMELLVGIAAQEHPAVNAWKRFDHLLKTNEIVLNVRLYTGLRELAMSKIQGF